MPIATLLALPLVLAAQGVGEKSVSTSAAPPRAAPVQRATTPLGLLPVYGAIPFGTVATTQTFTNSTPMPILDVATITSSVVVSGASANLWDIDLDVAITHTYCADLDITLIAPSGKWVTITTDNSV